MTDRISIHWRGRGYSSTYIILYMRGELWPSCWKFWHDQFTEDQEAFLDRQMTGILELPAWDGLVETRRKGME